jgi:hypothetical protein
VLSEEEQKRISLRDEELATYRFVEPDEAERLLRAYVWRRVEGALAALREGTAQYLRDSQRT